MAQLDVRKNGVNYGTYSIYLRGSRYRIRRCVYGLNGKHYIVFGKQCVEVVRSHSEYVTVDLY